MGTLGGKLGLIAGLLAAFAALDPVIALTPGRCLFEGGCGEYETLGLVAAAAIVLTIAAIVGAAVRLLVNRLVTLRD